mgnify:CR=1 FL=1
MDAAVSAPESASSPAPSAPGAGARRDYSHLRAYQFKAGNKPKARADGSVGRPKGSRSAQTILLKAAPLIARRYIKEALNGSAPVLVDSRRWILPDAEAARPHTPQLIIFMGDSPLLPRSVVADALTDGGDAPSTLLTASVESIRSDESAPENVV